MTTEEFEWHLMACLHGPSSGKIARRVLDIAFADAEVGKALGDAMINMIGQATDGNDEAIFELAVLAHLSEIKPVRGDTIKWSTRKYNALQRVRARLAASVRKHPDFQRIADMFMLDLDIQAGGD
jgi:hypothetical protein